MKIPQKTEFYVKMTLLSFLLVTLTIFPVLSNISESVVIGSTGTISAESDVFEITAKSGSSNDIQLAVNAVADAGGGTVHIPAGNFTFTIQSDKTKGVTIPGGVNVIGAGNNQTVLYCNSYPTTANSAMFYVDGSNDKPVRISGIMFQANVHGHLDTYPGQITGISLVGVKNGRVDHCTFLDMTGAAIGATNNYVHNDDGNCGVIDHCVIDNPYKEWYYSETGTQPYWAYGVVISHDANVADGYPNWKPDYTQYFGKYGSGIWYIEDCSMARCRHMVAGASQSNAFYCLRYNTMYDMQVRGYGSYQDVHGGGLGAECYGNTVINVGNNGIGFYSRGGFALYYKNLVKDVPGAGAGIILANDQSTHSDYRTHNVWIWDNTFVNVATSVGTMPNAFPIREGIEYWLRAPNQAQDGWTYTPYTYPHPLTNGAAP